MKLFEGRFGGCGFKPEGILGSVEGHFVRLLGQARTLSFSEQMLVRALVAGLLEALGGKLTDGRWEAELGEGSSSTISVSMPQISSMLDDFSGKVAEAVRKLHLRVDAVEDRKPEGLQELASRVNSLEMAEESLHRRALGERLETQLEVLEVQVRTLVEKVELSDKTFAQIQDKIQALETKTMPPQALEPVKALLGRPPGKR